MTSALPHDLQTLIASQGWALADGATGTNLFDMGLQSGDAPEFWNVTAPEKIEALYQMAVDAGSDLFLTNSFGGNAARLALHDAQDRVPELNRAAAALGRKIADRADRKILVAGSIGPTGEIFAPIGSFTMEEAEAQFITQGRALLEGGADLLWVETISGPEEFTAFARAAAQLNAPWCGTMSFDTAGRTMMGVTSHDFVALAGSFAHAPMAIGANCGTGASDLLRTILGMKGALDEAGSTLPLIAKGNAGIPKYVDGHIHYDGTPELMARYALMARACGASIIGGCCGTKPAHLSAMRHALESETLDATPSLEEIAAALGGFSSAVDGTEAPSSDSEADTRRAGRRRRRES